MQNPEMTSFSAADQEVEVEMLLHFSPQKFKSAARIYRGARNARKNTHIPARGYKGVALFFISNAHINAHPQEEPPHREETARPAPVTATTLPPSQRPRAGPRDLEAAQATAGAAARSCRLGRRRARPSSAGHRREKEAGLDGSQTRETRPTAPVRFEFFFLLVDLRPLFWEAGGSGVPPRCNAVAIRLAGPTPTGGSMRCVWSTA
jgi:hypothetical protein